MKHLIRKYKIHKLLNTKLTTEEKKLIDFLENKFPSPLLSDKGVMVDDEYSYFYQSDTNIFWIDEYQILDILVKEFKLQSDEVCAIIKKFIEYKFNIKMDEVYVYCVLTLDHSNNEEI